MLKTLNRKTMHHGFFKKTVSKVAESVPNQTVTNPTPKQRYNVGGNGDCGFRALAAAMVDNISTHPFANKTLCSKLLKRHLEIFSKKYDEGIADGYWTPAQRLERMRHKPEFIPDLAFTLRQIAVDEMLAHYKEKGYRGSLVDVSPSQDASTEDDQETLFMNMRLPHTWIDESAIAAVANALEVPVTVRVTESNKELFKPLHYGPEEASFGKQASGIEIQLQDKHYQPMLAQPHLFANVARQSFSQIPEDFKPNDPSLAEMIARIKAADQEMINEFTLHQNRLTTMVEAGELDKNQLLAIYIKGMGKKDNSGYLAGRIKQVGIEHGNQQFFENAIKNAGVETTVPGSPGAFDDLIVKELVRAIARALATTHDLSTDEVYSQFAEARSTALMKS